MTELVNIRQHELIRSELVSKGISRQVAQILAYEILVMSNITGQSYKLILKSISKSGIDFSKDVIDQLNLMRASGNKLGAKEVTTVSPLVGRELDRRPPPVSPI